MEEERRIRRERVYVLPIVFAVLTPMILGFLLCAWQGKDVLESTGAAVIGSGLLVWACYRTRFVTISRWRAAIVAACHVLGLSSAAAFFISVLTHGQLAGWGTLVLVLAFTGYLCIKIPPTVRYLLRGPSHRMPDALQGDRDQTAQ